VKFEILAAMFVNFAGVTVVKTCS